MPHVVEKLFSLQRNYRYFSTGTSTVGLDALLVVGFTKISLDSVENIYYRITSMIRDDVVVTLFRFEKSVDRQVRQKATHQADGR